MAMPEQGADETLPKIAVVAAGEDARHDALKLLRELRRAGLSAHMELEARSLKAQMKRADRVAARAVVIIGADELARGEVTLRLMQSSEQRAVPRAEVVPAVQAALGLS